ncbi:Formyl-CoA transferase [Hyphomicrobiales bacterium]|nr:CoA transferase [Hyphomicrobiales bacterium]CAH1666815.1 Formyl-CoA transferase [Hyphomicrobiales bacterium]
MAKRAFSGIRIVDFTHVLSGPFCTYQLGLLGADVIKVEEPGLGDYMRRRGSDRDLRRRLMGDHFLSLNANKRSIVIDLTSKDGAAVARRLIDDADVVVENFRAGVMEGLGLGYEAVSERNPRLIYCALSGYGRSGLHATRKVYDQVVQANSGLMSGTGEIGGGPIKSGSPVLDYSSGLMAAFAISAALFQRSADGLGQFIDVAMHDTALMLMSTSIMNQTRSGKAPRPHANEHPLAAASCYVAGDGEMIMLGCCTQGQFERLCVLIGRPDIAADPRFSDVNTQDVHRAALVEILQTEMRARSAEDWERHLADHVPASRVRSLSEGLDQARLNNRKVIRSIEPPEGFPGQVEVPVAAYIFGHDGPEITSFPPELGVDTRDVLREHGYDDETIERLIDEGAVETDSDRNLPI